MAWNASSDNEMLGNSSLFPPHLYDAIFADFPVQTHSVVFGIVLSVLTVVLNLSVICLIICEKQTRTDVYFLQIINLSLANIFTGLVVIPLTVYSILYAWKLGAGLCKFWIIFDNLLPFASITTLLILNIDRLIIQTHPKVYECLFQACLKQVILMTPWMTSLVIVVPLWTHGALPYELQPGECVIFVMTSAAVAFSIITYFIPLILIIIITLKILIVRVQTNQRDDNNSERSVLKLSTLSTSEQPNTEPEEQTEKKVSASSIASLCLGNFAFCAMWFPYQFVTLLITVCLSPVCMPSPEMIQAITWAATASAGVVPFVWFIDTKLKRNCSRLVCRIPNREDNDLTEDEV